MLYPPGHISRIRQRTDTETEPLKDYYEKQGKLTIVEGQHDIADTTAKVLKALED